MPKPRALRPDEIKRTLVGRFEQKPGGQPGLADKLRQLHTKFGARSRRVFLVWVGWTGDTRGEGDPSVVKVIELLPTPKVSDLTSVALNPYSAGKLPVGSIRVDEVSAAMSEDVLAGRLVAGGADLGPKMDFFYELREDGRSGVPSLPQRYRPLAQPTRRETNISWSIVLDRVSEDRLRNLSIPVDPDAFEQLQPEP